MYQTHRGENPANLLANKHEVRNGHLRRPLACHMWQHMVKSVLGSGYRTYVASAGVHMVSIDGASGMEVLLQ